MPKPTYYKNGLSCRYNNFPTLTFEICIFTQIAHVYVMGVGKYSDMFSLPYSMEQKFIIYNLYYIFQGYSIYVEEIRK